MQRATPLGKEDGKHKDFKTADWLMERASGCCVNCRIELHLKMVKGNIHTDLMAQRVITTYAIRSRTVQHTVRTVSAQRVKKLKPKYVPMFSQRIGPTTPESTPRSGVPEAGGLSTCPEYLLWRAGPRRACNYPNIPEA